MKILIVEDNPDHRELLMGIIQTRFQTEAKFREASNLQTAFKYLETGDFDCIVLDLRLPDSIGRESFDKIRARFPDHPIVVLTNDSDRELAIEMIQAGAEDFILKAYTEVNTEEVFRRIVFAVERRKRSIRVPTDRAATLNKLDRVHANLLATHTEGDPTVTQTRIVESVDVLKDISKEMFTEIQVLSKDLTSHKTTLENTQEVVRSLDTEVLRGAGDKHSMRAQVDSLELRVATIESRLQNSSRSYSDSSYKIWALALLGVVVIVSLAMRFI